MFLIVYIFSWSDSERHNKIADTIPNSCNKETKKNNFSCEPRFITRFFYKQHFNKPTPSGNWQKIEQMLSNTLRLNFCYLKIIHILHPRYHPNIIGYIVKNKQRNNSVCNHEIIQLIIMKMKMEIKDRSHRYDINRPRSRYGHKYINYKMYLIMTIFICIKQHLRNI